MNKFVSYEGLPINSGGAHGLGKKTAAESHHDTVEFLKVYADTVIPHEVGLTLYKGRSFNYQMKWKLMKRYGLFPKSSSWGIRSNQKCWTWKLKVHEVAGALDHVTGTSDSAAEESESLELAILWHFRLVDPLTKEALPHQGSIPTLDFRMHNSRILLTLGKQSRISVWFAFPFDSEDESFKAYIREFVKRLPFKPSDKHWRLWIKGEKGNWNPRILEGDTLIK